MPSRDILIASIARTPIGTFGGSLKDIPNTQLATTAVRALAPYVIGKPIGELARELGMPESRIIKLASNENPLGPSPLALAAMREALAPLAGRAGALAALGTLAVTRSH